MECNIKAYRKENVQEGMLWIVLEQINVNNEIS